MTGDITELDEAVHRMQTEKLADRAMSAALSHMLVARSATGIFFATLALGLKRQADWSVPTLCTNGSWIKYNPAFVMSLGTPERQGVLAHEVMHPALKHHVRRGQRDSTRWNIACDMAINEILSDSGSVLPSGALLPSCNPWGKFPPGLSAERYYDLLPSDAGNGEGGDPGGCGEVEDADRQAEAEAEWDVKVAQSAAASKQAGTLPGSLQRFVSDVLEPRVDWRDRLREFVRTHSRNDYTWFPCNHRFIHQGLYLPGLRSEEVGDIALAIDTSGSIGQAELSRFTAEVRGILESYSCKLHILYHDHMVQSYQVVEQDDEPNLTPVGGGGTSHKPVFKYIEDHDINPTCLICFTDMYSEFPSADPSYPVLWCCVGNQSATAPFGALLHVEV